MTKNGLLFVVSGPSGVGKDTVLARFLQDAEDCALSVSATTRAPRPGEVDGKDYHFITREQFGGFVARGEMLEYAEFNGNYYGTPKEAVNRRLARGENVLLEIEVQGALQIKAIRPDAVSVFLMPPSWETLRHRLEKRGTEEQEVIEQRLAVARSEIGQADQYDYIIVNDDLAGCCRRLGAVILAAGCMREHMKDFVKEVFAHA